MSTEQRMKPIAILPAGDMTPADIAELRSNGICVVECKNPNGVRFCQPPPAGYSIQEQAAIQLATVILNTNKTWSMMESRNLYAQILMRGTPLEGRPPEAPRKVKP
jgi:hypothetical protein